MVESAPLFIEHYCQGYVNCTAFNAVVAVLVIGLFASWFSGFFCFRFFNKHSLLVSDRTYAFIRTYKEHFGISSDSKALHDLVTFGCILAHDGRFDSAPQSDK